MALLMILRLLGKPLALLISMFPEKHVTNERDYLTRKDLFFLGGQALNCIFGETIKA